jgi:hypothetical protein
MIRHGKNRTSNLENAEFLPSLVGEITKLLSSPSRKNILLFRIGKSPYIEVIPSHRGALRNVNNAERDAMDAAVLARHVMAGRIGERSVSR